MGENDYNFCGKFTTGYITTTVTVYTMQCWRAGLLVVPVEEQPADALQLVLSQLIVILVRGRLFHLLPLAG